MADKNNLNQLLVLTFFAGLLWYFTFAVDILNFWLKISISASTLAIGSLFISKPLKNEFHISINTIAIGVFSAVVLYGIFYLGNLISGLLFDFSANQVSSIYHKGDDTNPMIIIFILLFITSPAEEIFWRGYLQNKLMTRYGDLVGFVFGTLIYGLVHIWSMNFMLVGAAMIAGAFWGLMYLKYRNVSMLIISHAAWTFSIFVLWPIR